MSFKIESKFVKFIEETLINKVKRTLKEQVDLYIWCDADIVNISGN